MTFWQTHCPAPCRRDAGPASQLRPQAIVTDFKAVMRMSNQRKHQSAHDGHHTCDEDRATLSAFAARTRRPRVKVRLAQNGWGQGQDRHRVHRQLPYEAQTLCLEARSLGGQGLDRVSSRPPSRFNCWCFEERLRRAPSAGVPATRHTQRHRSTTSCSATPNTRSWTSSTEIRAARRGACARPGVLAEACAASMPVAYIHREAAMSTRRLSRCRVTTA